MYSCHFIDCLFGQVLKMKSDHYLTFAKVSEGIFKDKGSKFIGYAFHVQSEEDVKLKLMEVRKLHPSARHVCYAYRIDPISEKWRANDDGEPSSSAGKPILNQLRSANLHNALIAVVRYFGGTLLGVPGLINAYKEAANAAIETNEIVARICTKTAIVVCPYAESGMLMKLAKSLQMNYKTGQSEDAFELLVEVNISEWEAFVKTIELHGWMLKSS